MFTIVEDAAVQAAFDDAVDKWEGCEAAWDAVKWVLGRDPMGAGPAVTESGNIRTLVYQGAQSNGQPTISVLYTVEENQVVINDAKFERPINSYAGNA